MQEITPINFSNIKYKGFINKKYFVDSFLNLLENPNEMVNKNSSPVIKHSDNATVAEISINLNGFMKEIVIKRWNKSGIRWLYASGIKWWNKKGIEFVFKTATRPMRVWNGACRLLCLGIPTAYPVAVLGRKKFNFLHEAFYMSEKILNSLTILEFSKQKFENQAIKTKVIVELTKFVSRLHKLSIFHCDLGLDNIRIQEASEDLKLYIFDIDMIKFSRIAIKKYLVFSLSRILITLSRLHNIKKSDIIAFLNGYSDADDEFKFRKKIYIKQIQKYASKRWPRDFLNIAEPLDLEYNKY